MSRRLIGQLYAGAALLCLASGTLFAASSPYPDGEMIEITGVVTNGYGESIKDLRLVFEASRRSFQIKKFKKVDRDPVRVTASTDSDGQFSIEWKWHRYYNHFKMSAVIDFKGQGGADRVHVIKTVDISQRMKSGSPVVAPMTLEDTTVLDSVRSFKRSIHTEDQRQVYDQMGKPSKVESVNFPDRTEVSWWYFEAGKTYRFRNGRLDEVVSFDPVEQFD